MNLSDAEKKAVVSAEAQLPDDFVFGLDIGTRSIVGTVGYRQPDGHFVVVAQAAVQHETIYVCPNILSMASCRYCAPLYTGINTLTFIIYQYYL